MNPSTPYLDSKKHYPVLDGLRGVAAVMVVCMHVMETFSGGNRFVMIINHGYLAVDFFFLLSGFVISYAYDDRWSKMTQWDFYKRRLVRLQPLVVLGSLVGAALFYLQQGQVFPLIADTPVWKLLLTMVIGATLIPVPVSMDIRGWQEMHPLNGPGWSLFFEYTANILYAILFRRFSKIVLAVFVALAACLLTGYLVLGPKGDLIGGWSINQEQLFIGCTRVLFPFTAGLLLCRMGKLIRVKGAFWWCAFLIVLVLSMPRIGGEQQLWMNGIYEAVVVILVFPLIVAMGAGGQIMNPRSASICKFLGDTSYPLYITHYPLIYTFTAWVTNNHIELGMKGLLAGFTVVIVSIVLAYIYLKLYDEPVREWLKRKFLMKKRPVTL
ncbi:acyltransferase [Niastella yeongjuensis]|uniref:Acyltransferase n=2 Tax=Niastella yeongjuensis TaxID=354355 RepID=A0A1V9EN45_9BACT|nr:acyltransferase [Niastella yeongjuensis]SEN86884.1 Peptidoglycan/LPS O-acetylase OafA/YrhL, contains acyltransferase and SGNH-hydrolase domains [Niastella yeongjuensis]